MYLGKVSLRVFPATGTLHPLAGDVAYILGFFVALVMWGFGIIWLLFALATIIKSRPFPFNMGWWGFTFPLGVFAASSLQLGAEMPSLFFRVLGTVCICLSFPLFWSCGASMSLGSKLANSCDRGTNH